MDLSRLPWSQLYSAVLEKHPAEYLPDPVGDCQPVGDCHHSLAPGLPARVLVSRRLAGGGGWRLAVRPGCFRPPGRLSGPGSNDAGGHRCPGGAAELRLGATVASAEPEVAGYRTASQDRTGIQGTRAHHPVTQHHAGTGTGKPETGVSEPQRRPDRAVQPPAHG